MKDFEEIRENRDTVGGAFERLNDIIELLRSDDGCPWDKVQTHESLKKCLIEECYEVIDAIDRQDDKLLEEEIGDVILQGVFHAQLGADRRAFDMISILNSVSNKMIFRHPHVFLQKNEEKRADTLDKALIKWENMKQQEKTYRTVSQAMEEIPKELPALMKSYKIQMKAKDVGFDWTEIEEAFKKVLEETAELKEAYACNDDKQHVIEEVGDLLFSVVNVARFLGVDPEEALNFTSRKFVKRFTYIEKSANLQGKTLSNMNLEEMDSLWQKSKMTEK